MKPAACRAVVLFVALVCGVVVAAARESSAHVEAGTDAQAVWNSIAESTLQGDDLTKFKTHLGGED
jgi:hypothetical protein